MRARQKLPRLAWLFALRWDRWLPRVDKRRLVYMRVMPCPRCGRTFGVVTGFGLGRERSFRCLRCVIKFDLFGNRYPWRSLSAGENETLK